MYRFILSFSLAFLTSIACCQGDDFGNVIRRAVEQVAESTLRIRTVGNSAEQGGITSQVTTGLSISKDGYVLASTFGFPSTTAAVFVEDADGQRVAAKLVARDSLRQLVLLKCDAGRFVVPKFAKKRWPEIGAYAIAAGRLYPAKSPSVSVGIVSAVNRVFGMALQTDAKISPVNYGGPLIGLDGEVMGILVPLSPRATGDGLAAGVEWYDSGIGFAIPAQDLLKAAERLRKGTDQVRGALGIELSTQNPLSPIVQIKDVLPGSPADQAGLKIADLIMEVNGVTIDRIGIFNSVVKSSYAGDALNMKVKRAGEVSQFSARLTDRLERPEAGYLGLILKPEGLKAPTDGKGPTALAVPGGPVNTKVGTEDLQVIRFDDAEVSSSIELARRLNRVEPGQTVNLTVIDLSSKSPKNEQPEPVVVSVQATNRPVTVPNFQSEALSRFLGVEQLQNWKQSEEDFNEDGKAWIYAPDVRAESTLGMLVLLSSSAEDNDTILRSWATLCEERGLVLVVPRNAERTSLTDEDQPLILKAIGAMSEKYNISKRRRILITDATQSKLTTKLILESEEPVAQGAAFLESWPLTAAYPPERLAKIAPNILLLEGKAMSRQQLALYQQAFNDLQAAKAWGVKTQIEADERPKAIANWFRLQQSF